MEKEIDDHTASTDTSLEKIKNKTEKKEDALFDLSELPKFFQGRTQIKSEFDDKLTALNGKNLSFFPLSEEMYKFIEKRVGSNNKNPFVFQTGPQILFEKDFDLLR